MPTSVLLKTCFATILSGLALSSIANAGVVTTLGTPTSNHTTIGDLPSWNGNGDKEDATFTSYISFLPSAGGSAQQLIWETGGMFTGASLVYSTGNTLYFRVRNGGTIADLSWELTANQLGAGELFVSWVIDLGNDEIRLIMDGLSPANQKVAVATASFTGNDWSGPGDAGFGTGNGTGFAGGYSGLSAFTGDTFTSGTINTTAGLDFYRDQAFVVSPVPEPLGALAGVAAIGFTCFRRRRELV